jgi:hypothetical protein
MENNNKVPLILFSGGLDSSFLLQEELKKGDVDVLYVKGVLHEKKMKEEEDRRDAIIEILQKSTGNKVRKQRRIDLGIMPFGNMEDQTFTQPPMWMMGALMVSDIRQHSELLIGYISGDQIMPMLPAIKAAWQQLQIISKEHGEIPVNFPLLFTTKNKAMMDLHPEVMRLVWYCEIPQTKYYSIGPALQILPGPDETEEERKARFANMREKVVPCGRCEACYRMQAAFFTWKQKRQQPYWKYLRRELKAHRRQEVLRLQIESEQAQTEQDRIESEQHVSELTENSSWPSSKSLSPPPTSIPAPCSSESAALEVMPSFVPT